MLCTKGMLIEGVANFANGSGHSNRGPLCQEIDDYKILHLECKGKFILS